MEFEEEYLTDEEYFEDSHDWIIESYTNITEDISENLSLVRYVNLPEFIDIINKYCTINE